CQQPCRGRARRHPGDAPKLNQTRSAKRRLPRMERPRAWTRDPLTLRFLYPLLEREFQIEMAATTGPQMRDGASVAVGLWLLAALIIPNAIVIDQSVVGVICVGMAAANLGGVVATGWATTLDRQQLI